MLDSPITVLAQSVVAVGRKKLKAGQYYTFDDSPYLRILIKSGLVALVDPPSLDPEFLEKAGYPLRKGYSYSGEDLTTLKPKKPEKISKEKEPEKPYLMKNKSEPASEETPPEKRDHEPHNLQLTPPVGMGVKTSEEE